MERHRLFRFCALVPTALLSAVAVARADLATPLVDDSAPSLTATLDLNLSLEGDILLAIAPVYTSTDFVMAPAVLGRPRSSGPLESDTWDAFERNRRFAMAGKILTVVGRLVTVGALIADNEAGSPYWGLMGVATAGELMWSGSDLRATNQLRERGYRLRKGAAIASVVGAVVFPPLTWIAGSIQSSRLREAREARSVPAFGARQ